ncbi:universal stress protein [Deinococcus aerophilus]|uniref:UspA domain-containing protein n=1 Tax=Deinococcus aerophilus TaxID=522488 RepID=A0ABQ2H036_9DEIO|nr:universal stress protein [Deinococcus aerophilus]GGM19783.1 hypothetical protein GCM10010841_29740 [Deinococcus aerophilus]
MFRHVLVPVDFGPCSVRAIAQTCELTRWSGGQVTLLHVLEQEGKETLAQQQLTALGRWCRRPPSVLIVPAHAGVVATILRVAERLHADLLVLGAHGRHDPGRRALGRVTCGVLLSARTPVQISPQMTDPAAHPLERWHAVGRL